MTEATQRTSDSGVSIWLDDLSRTRIESGSLQELIKDKNVVGVTTNPSIFQKALSQVGPYDAQLKELGKVDVETAIRELTTTDVRNATDIFREIAEATDFVDGRVSIEQFGLQGDGAQNMIDLGITAEHVVEAAKASIAEAEAAK